MSGEDCESLDKGDIDGQKPDKMFTLKKWNAVAMWSWDVECDTCAICRVQVMVAVADIAQLSEHPALIAGGYGFMSRWQR